MAGSVILPKSATAQAAARVSPNAKLATGGCGRGVVIASDAATGSGSARGSMFNAYIERTI